MTLVLYALNRQFYMNEKGAFPAKCRIRDSPAAVARARRQNPRRDRRGCIEHWSPASMRCARHIANWQSYAETKCPRSNWKKRWARCGASNEYPCGASAAASLGSKFWAVKLSIIDQSPVSEGSTPADALRNTIELAKLADRLGYERYWIAEHHGMVTLASPAPEILIARVAARNLAHPGRLRRRDAAALQPDEGCGDVQDAARADSQPHRPRGRARAGRNRPRDFRADARSQAP